ncbi:MAG TPA: hypothetical protein VMR37_01545, partial [Rhabdochlamydiaceae bacterium]|nr:hypothetical protein [Rhabdochlamydiaceae bacterium]
MKHAKVLACVQIRSEGRLRPNRLEGQERSACLKGILLNPLFLIQAMLYEGYMKHLGDYVLSKESFPKLEAAWKELKKPSFQKLPEQKRFGEVCRMLLKLIEAAPEDAFTLIPVLDFIERINQEKILEHFHFNNFELWLNQFSSLSPHENRYIRGKIAGRWVPREAYQVIFPVGMGKVYPGSHFVTAHGSPDLDTTIASFWGWVDAFAARLSEGLHVWNLPGGEPPAQVEVPFLFYNLFGS